MGGYDLQLIQTVGAAVKIPVVALGGASSLPTMVREAKLGSASGAAAGSLFVFHGAQKGVLINYPDKATIQKLVSEPHAAQAPKVDHAHRTPI
jgi:cyclase